MKDKFSSTPSSSPLRSTGSAAEINAGDSRRSATISCERCCLFTSRELAASSISFVAAGDNAGGADAAASFAHAVIACDVTAAPSGCVSTTPQRTSWSSPGDLPLRVPYSPTTHRMTSKRTFGSFGVCKSFRYEFTALLLSVSSAPTSPLPSPMSRIKLCATVGFTTSPPIANIAFIVSMNHCVVGAYRSASSPILAAVLSLTCLSVLVFRNSIIFSTTTSTLCDFVILYSRSNVLPRMLSSASSKQSTTVIWCSAAYFGLMFTIHDSESKPTYFRLWLLDAMNRLTAAAQCSRSTGEG
mmetsp:Transcript_10764/g.38974  ORF Transcript_10764/g.38974 Transcript_10764/m.38974 type:complete len:299 (-) Transcript_10764:981-1877(-)